VTGANSSTPSGRHLLSSQSLGPTNPLRVIAHCDVDAAYARASLLGPCDTSILHASQADPLVHPDRLPLV
jgi:hypothetical protein